MLSPTPPAHAQAGLDISGIVNLYRRSAVAGRRAAAASRPMPKQHLMRAHAAAAADADQPLPRTFAAGGSKALMEPAEAVEPKRLQVRANAAAAADVDEPVSQTIAAGGRGNLIEPPEAEPAVTSGVRGSDEPLARIAAAEPAADLLADGGAASSVLTSAVNLRVRVDGPDAADGGAGYRDGLFWAVVNMTAEPAAGVELRYALDPDEPLNCSTGSKYGDPLFLYNSTEGGGVVRVRAVACAGGAPVAREEVMAELVPGPSLVISTNLSTSRRELAAALTALEEAVCLALQIGEAVLCDGRVSAGTVQSEVGDGLAVSVLAASNVEAAAFRKQLLALRVLPSVASAAKKATGILGINVTVPVPHNRRRQVNQPCQSHYDCAAEVTGVQLINGTNVTQYGWGRAFCALWGSSLTQGIGPTCDSCRLYCTAAVLSSVDGVCPENCGTPWSGELPPCLSAMSLRETYNCQSRRKFEVQRYVCTHARMHARILTHAHAHTHTGLELLQP